MAIENHVFVHIIGPGFGESVVIQFPDGSVGVIDPYCGILDLNKNNRAELHPIIRFIDNEIKPERIRFILVTHPHADHCLGTSQLLWHFNEQIDYLWVYSAFLDSEILMYLNSARRHGLKNVDGYFEPGPILDELSNIDEWINANRSKFSFVDANNKPIELTVESTTVEFYGPTDQTLWRVSKPIAEVFQDVSIISANIVIPLGELPARLDLNDLSVVMRITCGELKLLFCGDAEKSAWDDILGIDGSNKDKVDLASHMVKISHHGSNNGYNEHFFPLPTIEPKPAGVLTPFNRGEGLPSSTALSEITPHFGSVVTTCFPWCPNLHLWKPSQDVHVTDEAEVPPLPTNWFIRVSKDDRLKRLLVLFPEQEDTKQEPKLNLIPANWIKQVSDEPSLLTLFCEPYKTALGLMAEAYKTNAMENLFRATYDFDTTGKLWSKSALKGAALYKGVGAV